jgi:hypothetical protein
MWKIIKDRSDKANMTDHLTSYDTVGYHALQEIPADRIECFEDMYMSARMGLWMQGDLSLVTSHLTLSHALKLYYMNVCVLPLLSQVAPIWSILGKTPSH